MTTTEARVETRVTPTYGVHFALLTAVAFGLGGPVAKALMAAGWTPAAVVVLRSTVAALVLAVPAVRAVRAARVRLGGHGGLVLAYGLVAVAGSQICYVAAIQHLPVSVTLLIQYSAPVLVIGYLWLRHGHRPGRRTALGGLVALVGLLLLLDLTSGLRLSGVGLAWAVGAMCCIAGYFILNAQTDHDLPPVALAASGLAVGGVAIALVAAVGLMPWATGTSPARLGDAALAPWLLAAFLGSALTAVPYLSAIEAGRRLGPRLASFLALTEVLAAVGFAWLLLSEVPAPIQAVGGVVLIAGVVVIKLEKAPVSRSDT